MQLSLLFLYITVIRAVIQSHFMFFIGNIMRPIGQHLKNNGRKKLKLGNGIIGRKKNNVQTPRQQQASNRH